ncbi:MAG: esterase-like activity of phytase family protein [Xanthomonadales bacterium]|nr:esterase-like activity of phytase family protein [Xanthomonadales bacterium]
MELQSALLTLALASGQATLVGWAQLDSQTLMPGPESGRLIEPPLGIEIPFAGQPVQGLSAIIPDGEGGYLALTDNGYGGRDDSADFLLRIYDLQVDFRTADGGSGEILVDGFLNLADPYHHLPWPLVADRETYGQPPRAWPVDAAVRTDRLLTGADLDPESLQRTADGGLWIGEEFGPYVVEFDPDGAVAGAPLRLPGLASEANPEPGCCDDAPTRQAASKGFEGMAMSPSGERLYPMLEGPMPGQEGTLNIYTVDTRSVRFLDASASEPSYRYRLDPPATAVGDFVLATDNVGLVLERDSGEGAKARHKQVFRVDLRVSNDKGFLAKRLVADLLRLSDPDDLDGDGTTEFSYPYHTPEALVVIDRNTIGVVNDNNFPFGAARGNGPDATEFILLRVEDLW